MYTLNLGVVFSRSNVVAIIVCSSDAPINQELATTVVMKVLEASSNQTAAKFFSAAIAALKRECNCNAVLVNADCATTLPI